jgi:hypothetical protein
MKRTVALDGLLILCLASVLIWPLFRLDYLDNWPSIESTFIADARMLGNNLPHPNWQPLWYCGTRFDYIYPPALRYGTALISKLANVSQARAYHLYTALFYIFGIAAVYWMVRFGSGSRTAAWLASVATALLSPSFLLLTLIRHDSPFWVPQRLHVLMAYGEGPHISALSILPAALGATFLALRRWRPVALAAAGALSALAVATNFYGATALAIFFPTMAWAVWAGERNWRVWLRAAGIAALAYGLCAFWLTPSYVKITLVNLQWVSQPGHTWSLVLALVALALYCGISLLLGKGNRGREWTVFAVGAALFLGLDVLGFYYLGFRVAGEPARLVPELDLALILLFVEVIRKSWERLAWRFAAVVMVAVAFVPAVRYLRHVWSPFPASAPLSSVYEYQTAEWVHNHLPGERVLPSGTVRFWFDAWSDNEQPDGGSMQGMLNQNLPGAFWQIEHGSLAGPAVLWLQALGTDAVIVPGAKSPEHYHDYEHPEKFRGALPVLYDDGSDTVIYGVPRVHPGLGRVVDTHALAAVGRVRGGEDAETLTKYLAVVEDASQAAVSAKWRGFDDIIVRTHTAAGNSVLLQESYDPSWRAFEHGKELTIREEPVMGFMLIAMPKAGDHAFRMHFSVPLENRVGQGLFVLSLVALLGLLAMPTLTKLGQSRFT